MQNINYYDSLIVRFLTGELSGDEKIALEQWLEASEVNRQYLKDFEKLWEVTDPPQPEKIPDITTSWNDLSERLNLEGSESHLFLNKERASTRRRVIFNYSLAAAAVLVFFVAYFTVLRQDPWKTEITQHGERLELTLADQSVVTMNAGSTIRYPEVFSDSIRLVYLNGQAFFDISHKTKPFIVQTANAHIRVLGTRFDVYARNQRTEVIVQQGKVRLSSIEESLRNTVILERDQMGILNKDKSAEITREENADFLIGWLHNRFVFYKTPLGEALAEMQRRHGVEIHLADEILERQTMSGSFEDTSVVATLEAFCLALNLNLSKQDDRFVISR
jgi:ferric-dicitrate binding protein FerR (iron transport regulator)